MLNDEDKFLAEQFKKPGGVFTMKDANWTFCGDHLTIYTKFESLYHTAETSKLRTFLFKRHN